MTLSPLYLIPGTMCDARLWQPMLDQLPWHSASICDYAAAGTLDDMVDAMLDQAPESSHLVGFSLGGYLAIAAAIRVPERFESLTVIAASPYGLTDAEKELRHRNAEMLTRLTYKGMSPTRLKQFVHPSRLDDPSITGTITAMDRDLGQQVLIRQLIAPIERPNIAASLMDLPLPIHFIMAEEDALVPIGAIEKLAGKSERIALHRLPDTGHMIPLERPEELAVLIGDITV